MKRSSQASCRPARVLRSAEESRRRGAGWLLAVGMAQWVLCALGCGGGDTGGSGAAAAAPCNASADCGPGEVCYAGACMPACAPAGCPQGTVCSGIVCLAVCAAPQDCPATGSWACDGRCIPASETRTLTVQADAQAPVPEGAAIALQALPSAAWASLSSVHWSVAPNPLAPAPRVEGQVGAGGMGAIGATLFVGQVLGDTAVEVTVTAMDVAGVAHTGTLEVEVEDTVDEPPEVVSWAPLGVAPGDVVHAGQALVFHVVAQDPNPADVLSYDWSTSPPALSDSLVAKGAEAVLTVPPLVTDTPALVTLRVSDGRVEVEVSFPFVIGAATGCPPGGCDDDNVCTIDQCDVGWVCHHLPRADGTVCDDGDQCTGPDACLDGTCTAAGPIACDDANPCTDDGCGPDAGCLYVPHTGPCDDGDACTSGDACVDGACVGGVLVADCDDGNPCTHDVCKAGGACAHLPLPVGTACDDGDACTVDEHCTVTGCTDFADRVCDDGNPCTADACESTTGCVYVVQPGPCDDGDACTVGDSCEAGVCLGGGAALDCDDGNPCTQDGCEPAVGCVYTPAVASCDDGDPCTVDDACHDGQCDAGLVLLDCDDGNPCTDDACTAGYGCVSTPRTGPCDDGNACTAADACVAGTCSGTPLSCDDGEACTKDACDPSTGCEHLPVADGQPCPAPADLPCTSWACTAGNCEAVAVAAGPCDDADACTVGDACHAGGACHGTPVDCDDGDACTADGCTAEGGCTHGPLDCDDGDACTLDGCAPDTGCVHQSLDCDDGDACTSDTCAPAFGCMYAPVDCHDALPCTADGCDSALGCLHVALDCDDGDACTQDGCLDDGSCTHEPIACDDGKTCTVDGCDAAFGCVFVVTCDDGDACTEDVCNDDSTCSHPKKACDDGDACTEDVCGPQGCVFTPADCDDGDACTADTCEEDAGCVHTTACDDGDVCTEDACDGTTGACDHPPVDCDDGDACTDDTCAPATGCAHTPACDDGDACTVDGCAADGTCTHGPLDCNDGDPCTGDPCDPATGCSSPCDDGDSCTVDTCMGGSGPVCTHAPVDCDDGDPCTADVCSAASGCLHAPVDCDDGGPCTVDLCHEGTGCVHQPLVCDDGDACTVDYCGNQGCASVPLPCDDGDPCSEETCESATGCVVLHDSCDDGNPCTQDTCMPNGCVHAPAQGPCDDGDACTSGDHCADGACVGEALEPPNVALGQPVSIGEDTASDQVHGSLATLVDGVALAEGTQWQSGTVWWEGTGVVLEVALPPDTTLVGARLQADGNDSYEIDVHSSAAASWTLWWPVKPTGLDGMRTRPDAGGGWKSLAPVHADRIRVRAVSGDGFFSIAEIELFASTCADDNPCTLDEACAPDVGCVHTPVPGPCDDGDAATDYDTCSGGVCQGLFDWPCDDGNPCTDDQPVAGGGCTHTLRECWVLTQRDTDRGVYLAGPHCTMPVPIFESQTQYVPGPIAPDGSKVVVFDAASAALERDWTLGYLDVSSPQDGVVWLDATGGPAHWVDSDVVVHLEPATGVLCGGEENTWVQIALGAQPETLLGGIGHPAGGIAGDLGAGGALAWSEVLPSSCNLGNAAVFSRPPGEQATTVFKWSTDGRQDVVFGTLPDGSGFLVATAEDAAATSWTIARVDWKGARTLLYAGLPGTDASPASSWVGAGGRFFYDAGGTVLELGLDGSEPQAHACPPVGGAALRLVDVYAP